MSARHCMKRHAKAVEDRGGIVLKKLLARFDKRPIFAFCLFPSLNFKSPDGRNPTC